MKMFEKGEIVKGTVSGITEYGIFVKLDEKYNGLVHISEMSSKFVRNPKTFAEVNDVINVEILDIDKKKSQIKLSIKNIQYKENKRPKRKKIVETKHGFTTLGEKLPFWIEENLKTIKKQVNYIDK